MKKTRMKKVLSTREGLIGEKTASGYIIDEHVPFVALPSKKGLYRAVKVRRGTKQIIALVLDVGPWNIHDDAYVLYNSRPQAESGTDMFGRKTNKAGIDLSEKVWKYLDMTDNGDVEWEF